MLILATLNIVKGITRRYSKSNTVQFNRLFLNEEVIMDKRWMHILRRGITLGLLIISVVIQHSQVTLLNVAAFLHREIITLNSLDQRSDEEIPILYELTQLRTIDQKYFLKEDGKVEVSYYSEPIHYLKDGRYYPIESELIYDESTQSYTNKAHNFKITFPETLTASKSIKVSKDDSVMEWTHRIDSDVISTAVISNETTNTDDIRSVAVRQIVTYPNIQPGVDLRYTITGFGIKEDYVVKNPVDNLEFITKVQTKNIRQQNDTLVHPNGKWVGSYDPLVMVDAKGLSSTDITKRTVQQSDNIYHHVITPSEEFLKNAAYPLVVDPSITFNTSSAVQDKELRYVLTTGTTAVNSTSSTIRVGVVNSRYEYRMALDFLLSDIPAHASISSAKLTLTRSTTSECGVSDVNCSIQVYSTTTPYPSIGAGFNGAKTYVGKLSAPVSNQMSLDVTKQISAAHFTSTEHATFILANADVYSQPNAYAVFNAVEYADQTVRPTLAVIYSTSLGLYDHQSYVSEENNVGTAFTNISNGNLVVVHNDFTPSSNEPALSITHIYNSFLSTINSGYGEGWNINLDEELSISSVDGEISLVTGDQRTIRFGNEGTYSTSTDDVCYYRSLDGSGIMLYIHMILNTSTITKVYRIDKDQQVKYHYTKIGSLYYLSAVEDMTKINNNTSTISHQYLSSINEYVIDQVVAPSGNMYQFNYLNGRLSSIDDIRYVDGINDVTVQSTSYIYGGVNNLQLQAISSAYDYQMDGTSTSSGISTNFTYLTNDTTRKLTSFGLPTTVNGVIPGDTGLLSISYHTNDRVLKIERSLGDDHLGYVNFSYVPYATTVTDHKGDWMRYS